jgi:hypothetical protein
MPGKLKATDPVQNGVQHSESSDIFSPLREGWFKCFSILQDAGIKLQLVDGNSVLPSRYNCKCHERFGTK